MPLRVAVLLALVVALVPAVPLGAVEVVPRTVVTELGDLASGAVDGRSPVLRAPAAFSLLGAAVPAGAAVAVRTSADGRTWSAWTALEPLGDDDGGPDPGTGEGGDGWREHTDPLWVGAARWVQVDAGGADLAAVRLSLVDSVGLDRSPLERLRSHLRAVGRTGAAEASSGHVGAPPITTRRDWGADERLRSGRPGYTSDVRGIVVHHTAGSNGYARAEAPAVVRGIYAYHTRSLGWNDIGYNLLVDRFGRIYEGRHGGLERAVIGAHAGGFNAQTVGVAVIGHHVSARASSASLEAVARVLAWKGDLHGLDPMAWTTMTSRGSTRFASGTRVRVPVVHGHRDLSRTACPGDALYDRMQPLREAAAQQQRDARQPAPRPPLIPPLPRLT
jgi:hypothetical protein